MTAPLVGEPLAGRRVFGVWRFAPFGSAGVMFASAADDALGAPAIRLKNESHAKASPTRQRRRPPPVAETGRSCWGSGQQGASAFARSNRWEPQPGQVASSVSEDDGEVVPEDCLSV